MNQGKKKREGVEKNRKLKIIMEVLNNHFTKGKTYIKTHSPLKTPGVVPPPYAEKGLKRKRPSSANVIHST